VRSHLADAVTAYRADNRPDEAAERVLDRLLKSEDGRAEEAFAAVVSGAADDAGRWILTACIGAEEMARTFVARVAAEQALQPKLRKLLSHVKELRAFIQDLADGPDTRGMLPPPYARDYALPRDARIVPRTQGPLAYYVVVGPDGIRNALEGLGDVQSFISARLDLARSIPESFHATRKQKIREAGKIAAMKHLAKQVSEICGTPHDVHVPPG